MSGFIYIWFDTHHKMFYVGSHWGSPDDGYVCSSNWMKRAHKKRPQHFTYPSGKPRRKIIARVENREDLLKTEQYFLNMIEEGELGVRYYNLCSTSTGHWLETEKSRLTVGQKISAAKKGKKTGPRDPSVGKAISTAKQAKFDARKSQGLPCYDVNPWQGANMARVQTTEINEKRGATLKASWADRPVLTCPKCQKTGRGGSMYRFHFEKCRTLPVKEFQIMIPSSCTRKSSSRSQGPSESVTMSSSDGSRRGSSVKPGKTYR